MKKVLTALVVSGTLGFFSVWAQEKKEMPMNVANIKWVGRITDPTWEKGPNRKAVIGRQGLPIHRIDK